MRVLLLATVTLCACGKREPEPPAEQPERVAVPTEHRVTPQQRAPDPALAPDEGRFEVVAPTAAALGVATTARIRVVPGAGFHINEKYPLVVHLTPADGVTAAKGEPEPLGERELSIPITVTPTAAGRHAVTGSIRFGICKRDACLSREMPIAIDVIAS